MTPMEWLILLAAVVAASLMEYRAGRAEARVEALERKMEAMGVYLSDVVVLDGPEFAEARITIHNEWPRKKWAEYELTFTRNVPRPDWEKDL